MNAAALQARYDGARPFNPASPSGQVRIEASPFRWPDHRTLPRRPWVWGRWLLLNTVTAIVAPGGVGKSSFVASMLLSLASARQDLLGKTVWNGAKRVWYWNLEDDLAELEMQLVAAAMFHGVSPETCGDRLFLDSGLEGDGLCIALDMHEGVVIEPVVEALVAELQRRKIDVLVIDPFVSSHGVSENDNGAIDKVVKTWARIAKRAGCSIVLVHHTKKLGTDKVTAEASRGASSLVSAARVTLVLNRMDKEEAKHFGIAKDRERKRLFTVQDDKANRAPAEDAEWFRLASQNVDNSTGADDPYGEEGDSVGVVTRWTPPDPFEGISTDHLLRVQRQIADGAWKESVLAKDWAGFAVANALGLDAGKGPDSDRARISQLLRTWVANGALVVVPRRDPVKRENKPYVEVGHWADQVGAPVAKTGAGQSGASGASEAPRPSCPPMGQRGGAGDADGGTQPGRFPAGNPAFKPILGPGETGDEPSLGWEDFDEL